MILIPFCLLKREAFSDRLDITDPELKDIIQNENIYAWLGIKPDDSSDPEKLKIAIENRKKSTSILLDFFTDPEIANLAEEDDISFLQSLISFLTNPNSENISFSPEEQKKIKSKLQEKTGVSGEEFNAKNPIIYRFIHDLEKIIKKMQRGEERSDVLDRIDKITSAAEKITTNIDASNMYKDRWLSAAACTVTPFNDRLGTQTQMPEDLNIEFHDNGMFGGVDPFLFLGFVEVPNQQEIDDKKISLDNLASRIPSKNAIEDNMQVIKDKYNMSQIRQNCEVISSLSRRQVESMHVLSQIFLQLATTPPSTQFQFNFEGKTLNINNAALIEKIRKVIFPEKVQGENVNSSDNILLRKFELNELIKEVVELVSKDPNYVTLLNLLQTLNDFSLMTEDLTFGLNDKEGKKNTALNFIKDLNYPNPIFEVMYQLYDGDMTKLVHEKRRYFKKSNRLSPSRSIYEGMVSVISSKQGIVQKLSDLRKDDGKFQKIVDLHHQYLQRISDGDFVLSENIEEKRDPQNFIKQLHDLAINLVDRKYPQLARIMGDTYISFDDIVPPKIKSTTKIEDLGKYPDIQKLIGQLTLISKILFNRQAEILTSEFGAEQVNPKIQQEMFFIEHHLRILVALGFDIDNIKGNNVINSKPLMMYLNGLSVNPINSGRYKIKDNCGKSNFTFSRTEEKLKIA